MPLANDLFKGLGAIFSCQYKIGHDGKVPFTIGFFWLSASSKMERAKILLRTVAFVVWFDRFKDHWPTATRYKVIAEFDKVKSCARKTRTIQLQANSYEPKVKFDEVKFPGGERGIRTLGTAFNSTHDFQSCSFSQLGHLSRIPLMRNTINL